MSLEPAFGGLESVVGQPEDARLGRARANKIEVADHRGQQIVEVVGDAAGEMTDRLHLLCLHQRSFGLLALSDLEPQAFVGLGEIARSFLDPPLQGLIEPP